MSTLIKTDQNNQPLLLLHRPSYRVLLTAVTILLLTVGVLFWRALLQIDQLYLGGWRRDAGLYSYLSALPCAQLFSRP